MKQSRIDFIKEAHEAACSTWKAKIEAEFPKLFKQEGFKVGDWVTDSTHPAAIGRINRIEGNQLWGNYGGNDWETYYNATTRVRKATPSEIESHLIEEAKRRGYVGGINLRPIDSTCDDVIWPSGNGFTYNKEYDFLRLHNAKIYMKGQWAEIIEQVPTDVRDIICKYGKEELKKYL